MKNITKNSLNKISFFSNEIGVIDFSKTYILKLSDDMYENNKHVVLSAVSYSTLWTEFSFIETGSTSPQSYQINLNEVDYTGYICKVDAYSAFTNSSQSIYSERFKVL